MRFMRGTQEPCTGKVNEMTQTTASVGGEDVVVGSSVIPTHTLSLSHSPSSHAHCSHQSNLHVADATGKETWALAAGAYVGSASSARAAMVYRPHARCSTCTHPRTCSPFSNSQFSQVGLCKKGAIHILSPAQSNVSAVSPDTQHGRTACEAPTGGRRLSRRAAMASRVRPGRLAFLPNTCAPMIFGVGVLRVCA